MNKKVTCVHCSNKFKLSDTRDLDGETYCTDCFDDNFSYCDDCSEYKPSDNFQETIYSRFVCNDCFEDYINCYECGLGVSNDDDWFCDNCDNAFCRECYYGSRHIECADGEEEEGNRVGYFDARSPKIEFPDSKPGKEIPFNNFVGLEFEVENGNASLASDNIPAECGITTDGSLSNGIEVQTPPRAGRDLETMIDDTCKALREASFEPTTKAGLHAHVDIREIRKHPIKLSRLMKTIFVSEDILFSMLPASRWQNQYCMPLKKTYSFDDFQLSKFEKRWGDLECDMNHYSQTAIERYSLEYLKRVLDDFGHFESCYNWNQSSRVWYSENQKLDIDYIKKNPSRYNALNVQAMFSHKTLEFRHHASTLNPTKVKNWVKLLLTLVNYSQSKSYDNKRIKELLKLPFSTSKLERFFEVFEIDLKLQNYIRLRIAKFNPEYQAVLDLQYKTDREDN